MTTPERETVGRMPTPEEIEAATRRARKMRAHVMADVAIGLGNALRKALRLVVGGRQRRSGVVADAGPTPPARQAS